MNAAQTSDDDEAQMLEGFNSGDSADQPDSGSSDQTQKVTEATAGQQDATNTGAAEPSSSAEAAVDPYAGLPEAVKTLLAKVPDLEARTAAAEESSRRFAGQVRSMQSQLAKLPTAAPAPAAPRTLEKLQHAKDTLGSDMPELMEALEELAALHPPQQSQTQAPAPETATSHGDDAGEGAKIDPVTQAHFQTLDEVRPDWFQTLESGDCQQWLDKNPAMAKAYSEMRTAGQALKVLGAYDSYRQEQTTANATASARSSRMAAGVLPRGHAKAPGKAAPASEEEAMSIGFNS